jgi:hypothetical protein
VVGATANLGNGSGTNGLILDSGAVSWTLIHAGLV